MGRKFSLFAAGALAMLAAGGSGRAAEPRLPAAWESVHQLVKPHEGEGDWAAIPWLTSLWEARQTAAAKGKPILLWEMDGHPLGCT